MCVGKVQKVVVIIAGKFQLAASVIRAGRGRTMKRSKFTADGRQGARVRTDLAEPLGPARLDMREVRGASPAR
jgi:hypothetical protein